MLAALKSRQEALEETLRQRLEELKKLCLREAVGTGHFITWNTLFLCLLQHACCLEVGWTQKMRFLPQSHLTKPVVQWPQGDPAVSTPDCKVQGFLFPEKGTPNQLGTQLAWGMESAQHPCLLFEIVNKLHSVRLLINFDKNILLPKSIGRLFCVLVITSQRLFTPLAKKTPRLAHFLLGAGPTLHAFLLQACSVIRGRAHEVSCALCRLPSSSQLWHCWKGMPMWWQNLQRGNTVVIPGHAGQLRNS